MHDVPPEVPREDVEVEAQDGRVGVVELAAHVVASQVALAGLEEDLVNLVMFPANVSDISRPLYYHVE